jgi:DNA-directed RNA polymerase specialized sigma24 family protein
MSNGRKQQGRSNVESFQILYSRYFKQVYYSAFSITKDRELAQDVYRQALLLVYEYGLTYKQLADCQKTSISAVKLRIHRAKQKLRGVALQMEEPV